MKLIVAAIAALATSASLATEPAQLKTPQLLQAYWTCFDADDENNSKGVRMDEGTLAACSMISKELQQRHFGNDFGRLHEWTKKNRASRPLKL